MVCGRSSGMSGRSRKRRDGPSISPASYRNRTDLDRARRYGIKHLDCPLMSTFHDYPRSDLEHQSLREPLDCIPAIEIANQFQGIEHDSLEVITLIGKPPKPFGAA